MLLIVIIGKLSFLNKLFLVYLLSDYSFDFKALNPRFLLKSTFLWEIIFLSVYHGEIASGHTALDAQLTF